MDHSARNTSIAGYLTLSAVAPNTMQDVTIANVPWNSMNWTQGIVPLPESYGVSAPNR